MGNPQAAANLDVGAGGGTCMFPRPPKEGSIEPNGFLVTLVGASPSLEASVLPQPAAAEGDVVEHDGSHRTAATRAGSMATRVAALTNRI